MVLFNLGDKVKEKKFHPIEDHIRFSGTICGIAFTEKQQLYLVRLDHGAYAAEDKYNYWYASVIVIHPDGLELRE